LRPGTAAPRHSGMRGCQSPPRIEGGKAGAWLDHNPNKAGAHTHCHRSPLSCRSARPAFGRRSAAKLGSAPRWRTSAPPHHLWRTKRCGDGAGLTLISLPAEAPPPQGHHSTTHQRRERRRERRIRSSFFTRPLSFRRLHAFLPLSDACLVGGRSCLRQRSPAITVAGVGRGREYCHGGRSGSWAHIDLATFFASGQTVADPGWKLLILGNGTSQVRIFRQQPICKYPLWSEVLRGSQYVVNTRISWGE